jgi:hypothetical protein
MVEKIAAQIEPYVPKGLASIFAHWIVEERVHLSITRPRASKLGDYRPPRQQAGHRISINGDLNPYAFSITFVHEFAHLHTWKQYGHKVAPHGEEWKTTFKQLMEPFLKSGVFPPDLEKELHSYFLQTHAASCRHVGLMKALAAYNVGADAGWVHLDELPEGAAFITKDGRSFIKGERIRKNFYCIEKPSMKRYIVNPLFPVKAL